MCLFAKIILANPSAIEFFFIPSSREPLIRLFTAFLSTILRQTDLGTATANNDGLKLPLKYLMRNRGAFAPSRLRTICPKRAVLTLCFLGSIKKVFCQGRPYTDSFLLPLRLRFLTALLPPVVFILTKKPCVLALFLFFGLYVNDI